jgi:predicted TPR repeat methyltransferase
VATDFDERARTWDDDPGHAERSRVVAEAVRAAVPVAPSTRLLDYGAGTGLTSQALAGHVGQITLAEPSAGMRAVMQEKLAAGALPPGTRIWDLDLAHDEPPDDRVDLIVTVATLHHIHDLDPVLRGFATLLSDGGHLCVVDLEEEDGSFHGNDPGFDGHRGFNRTDLTGQLRAAGFRDVRFERVHQVHKDGATYPLFLAVCET